ncbi:uncharacterized protein LOC142322248 [Lycorma delicatula]|uniref:uncharacterized protein LOC142322248 n=1 Tax=Lycorma delicatula TaxID=130591 RepID=UPI003F5166E9
MGTCFSYLKRNVKLERRQHSHYCLTPRSFYQRDTETVELQYLVSHVSNTVDTDPDANIYVADNDTLCGSEVADINENISCHSKRCSSNKKRKLIHRSLQISHVTFWIQDL